MFDAHDRVFAFFEGTCRRSIYDTMSTVVDMVFVGKDRAYNRRLVQISGESYRLKDKRRAGIMAKQGERESRLTPVNTAWPGGIDRQKVGQIEVADLRKSGSVSNRR